jgi:hypothetical protein
MKMKVVDAMPFRSRLLICRMQQIKQLDEILLPKQKSCMHSTSPRSANLGAGKVSIGDQGMSKLMCQMPQS